MLGSVPPKLLPSEKIESDVLATKMWTSIQIEDVSEEKAEIILLLNASVLLLRLSSIYMERQGRKETLL